MVSKNIKLIIHTIIELKYEFLCLYTTNSTTHFRASWQAMPAEQDTRQRLIPGGASQPKSVAACSKMKIRKDPYCVDFHLGFIPHSTQCWVTPHIFYVNGVTDKAPIPHNSSTFCKYCCRKWAFFVWKHHIPHTFCVILSFIPISHPLLQISHPFCAHTIPHRFSIFDPPFHTKFFSSMLLHIFAEPPPRAIALSKM